MNVPVIMNKTKLCPANTITVDTDAYTAGDVVGGLITVPIGGAGGGGIIRDIYLCDVHNQDEPYTLYIFRTAPATIADDAAFDAGLATADITGHKLIHKVSLLASHYSDVIVTGPDTYSRAHIPDLALDFDSPLGNLYIYMVCTATPDYNAGTDLSLALNCWIN